jgi:hypothetical protein
VPADATDLELRVFGVVIGLLVLAALWLNARWLRLGAPLISIALVGFNPLVIRYGDSIRAYGLGMLMVLLCLGAMWRFVERGTNARAALALITAVLSVQCLYYNSFLLLAICAGAVAVCLRRRVYRPIFTILGIGAVAAASLVIYLPTIRKVGSTNFFWKVDFTAAVFWSRLSETLGSPLPIGTWWWIGLTTAAILGALWCLLRPAREESRQKKEVLLFGLVTLVIGSAAYIAFLFHLSYLTQPWYYIVFVAFAAMCLEMIVATLPFKPWVFRTGFALALIGLTAQPAFAALQARQSNVDTIAAHLSATAVPGDLILINTWNYGISFRRYYRGEAVCATIPPIHDLRFHRMDLVHAQLVADTPMAPVVQALERTLHAGNTVWLVGDLRFLPPERAAAPPSTPRRNSYALWSEQAAAVVQQHATHLARVPLPPRPTMHYEDLPLFAIRRSGD